MLILLLFPHTHTGEFRIAGIFPIFAEVNTDLFTAAAVDLVNQGVWDPTFPGKPVHVVMYRGAM